MPQQIRVLFLNWKDLSHPAAGGAETFVQCVGRELVRRGHHVTLFAARSRGCSPRDEVQGVEIVRAGGRFTVYQAARRFWREQAPGSFDVVVDTINTRPFMATRWAKCAPVVALIYQLARDVWFAEMPLPVAVLGRYVLEPLWLRAYRSVPAITISESSAASLREHHEWTDLVVVPVGLEMKRKAHVSKELRPTVIFLGRLVRMKRPDHAIEAFTHLQRAFPQARLWLVGTGPLYERLRTLAPPGVELLGRVSDADRADLLTRAHVLVATSIREGWGLSVSEAAVCGTPSIGYSVPGLVDSIPASGGALVDSRPEALGDALTRFFRGELKLIPRESTRSWPEVAEKVERKLLEAVASFDASAGRRSEQAS